MLFRVSFYRESEVVEGRAPRYSKDVEARNAKEAEQAVEKGEKVCGVYKKPKNSPTMKKGKKSEYFVFMTPDDRIAWYEKLKLAKKPKRKCKTCKGEVGPYQRECDNCKAKKESKTCMDCGTEIDSRRRCEPCAEKREKELERDRRISRRAQELMDDIERRLALSESLHPTGNCCECLSAYMTVQKARLQELRKGNLAAVNMEVVHTCKCEIAKLITAPTPPVPAPDSEAVEEVQPETEPVAE